MAIFSPGPIVGGISGKLGGVVFVNSKKQSVVRFRPGSPRVRSPRQQNALALFTQLQRSWEDLTDEQRQSWRSAASQTTIRNRLGHSSPPGAFQLFVRENARLRLGPGTLMEIPPAHSRSNPARLVSADFTAGGPYNVEANPGEFALSASFFVYGWTQCKTYFTNTPPKFRLLANVAAPSLNLDVQDEWEAIYGPLAVDQTFTIAVAERIAAFFISDQVIVRGTTVV